MVSWVNTVSGDGGGSAEVTGIRNLFQGREQAADDYRSKLDKIIKKNHRFLHFFQYLCYVICISGQEKKQT